MSRMARSCIGRRTARIGGIALVAAVSLAVAACDVPAQPAGDLFNAWVANDHAAAAAVATPSAVTQMFSQTYSASTGWFFDVCDGAAGSTYCTWITNIEGRMVLQITNSTQKVTNVSRRSLGSIEAGKVFHAWRIHNSSAAAPYATPGAVYALFLKPYSPADHWTPEGCEGTAGSLYCTWHDDAAQTIILQVRTADPQAHQVIGVSGTFHP